MIERLATDKELVRWREFEKEFDRFTQVYYRTIARAQNASAAYSIAQKHKVVVPWNEQAQGRFVDCRNWYLKTRDLIRGVEDHSLGIRLINGDLDIVQPQEDGEMHGWFIPILVVVGVALLVGAIAETMHKRKQLEESEAAFKGVTDFADQRFCIDPTSQLCMDWKKTKNLEQYRSNDSVIDRLSKSISQTGSKISSGLAVGLMIAVPLIAWSWLGKRGGS